MSVKDATEELIRAIDGLESAAAAAGMTIPTTVAGSWTWVLRARQDLWDEMHRSPRHWGLSDHELHLALSEELRRRLGA